MLESFLLKILNKIMSEWFDMKKEDISLSDKKDELHIWFEQDNNGNRYVSVNMDDLLEVLKDNKLI